MIIILRVDNLIASLARRSEQQNLTGDREMAKITRQALESGKIIHTGWAFNGLDTMMIDGVRPEQSCDVSVWMYFDASGKFLGPDENGLEPTFAAAK